MAKPLLFLLPLISIISFSQNLPVPASRYVFSENKGQLVNQHGRENKSVRYFYASPGLNVQLRDNGFSYDVYEAESHTNKAESPASEAVSGTPKSKNLKIRNHRIDVSFEGANKNPSIFASGQSDEYNNYYNLPHKPQGISNVRRFQKVIYKDLYPNIDLVFFKPYDEKKAIEYNFILKPGGKISDIKLKFSGAKSSLKDGKIQVDMIFGKLQESVPASWLEEGAARDPVEIGFKEIKKGVFGFRSEKNSYDKTLVIDPVPTRLWGSYIGGSGEDYAQVTVDADNNIYLHGATKSTENIATEGTYQNNLAGSFDGFIMKVDKNGRRLWGTYYGKELYDFIPALDFDAQNNIYAAASVESRATYYSQLTDFAILKLTPEGRLLFEKLLGGPNADQITDIKFHNGWVYASGYTMNTEINPNQVVQGPATQGRQLSAGFLGRFDSNSGDTVWLKLMEGNASLLFNKFIDLTPDLEIIGVSRATDLPMIRSFQGPKISSSFNNGIYLKFTPEGEYQQLAYFGENASYNFDSVQRFGDEIMVGGCDYYTNTAVFFTANTSTLTLSSWKIPNFSSFQITTYIDRDRNMFVAGGICSSDTPPETTPNAYMPVRGTYCASAFIKHNYQREKIWATYYTGNRATQLGGITKDNEGFLYFYGLSSGNTSGIATPGAFQEYGMYPSNDGFIAKFADAESFAGATFTPLCSGSDLRFEAYGGESYEWFGPNGFHSFEQNPVIRNAQQIHSGEYFVRMRGGTSQNGIFTVNASVGTFAPPKPDNPNLPEITGNCNTVLIPPTATDGCGNKIVATTTKTSGFAPGNYTVTWNFTSPDGQVFSQSQKVTINSVALPAGDAQQEFCKIDQPKISALRISGENLKWFDSLGNSLSLETILANDTKYYVTQTINGCESAKKEILVTIKDNPAPTGPALQEFCPEQNAKISSLAAVGQNIVWYDGAGNIQPATAPLVDGQIYYASQTSDGCQSSQKLAVQVKINLNSVNATDISETYCSETFANAKTVDLKDFESKIISTSSAYQFTYPSGNIQSLKLGVNTFNVKVSTPQGCFKEVKITLTLHPKPELSLPSEAEFCTGKNVELDAGSGFSTYLWSTGQTTQKISVDKEGVYTVKGTTAASCETSGSATVKKSVLAQITHVEILNSNAKVLLSGAGDFLFSLDNLSWQKSEVFNGLKNGKYSVFVRTSSGCTIGQRNFTIFSITNSFTPNGDGMNDTWKIDGLENYPGSQVSIYDRFGLLVHQKTINGLFAWNGEHNGRKLPTGSYWYVVNITDGRTLQGYVLIKNRN